MNEIEFLISFSSEKSRDYFNPNFGISMKLEYRQRFSKFTNTIKGGELGQGSYMGIVLLSF
jgi:hypothetical protein